MPGDELPRDGITTDLLVVWTDPDTTMEAVGRTFGVFGERAQHSREILGTDSQLRISLQEMLVELVDAGVLETRGCSDGRNAFRWRDGIASSLVLPPKEPAPAAVAVAAAPTATEPRSRAVRPTEQAALLLIAAVSCMLAVLVFVSLNTGIATAIAAVLILAGLVGVVRRVPFAGAWTIGLTVAGCLLHFS